MADVPLFTPPRARYPTRDGGARAVERVRLDDGTSCAGAIVGLPFDGAIPTRPGARRGPDALRTALARYAADRGSHRWPSDERLTDLGDVRLAGLAVGEAHDQVGRALEGTLGRVEWLLAIGGDHSLTFPVFRALTRARGGRWGLIALDAHHDVRSYTAEQISSGTPFRRCLELGPDVLDPRRLVQIGIRPFANALEHRAWCEEWGVGIIDVAAVRERGAGAVAAEALAVAGDGADHLYLSIDLDVLDQSEGPGTSAAGPDGLRLVELLEIVEQVAASDTLRAADLMELSPRWDAGEQTARAAARTLLAIVSARGSARG